MNKQNRRGFPVDFALLKISILINFQGSGCENGCFLGPKKYTAKSEVVYSILSTMNYIKII